MVDCCSGFGLTRREWLRRTLVTSSGIVLAGRAGIGTANAAAEALSPLATALKVLKENVSIDVHTHAGPTGVFSRTPPTDDAIRAMRAGKLSSLCLSEVPDAPLLGRRPNGVLGALRQPAPGELYKVHLNRLAWLDDLVNRVGMRRALTVADLKAAHAAGEPAVIEDIEGLDFLERKLERLEEAYQRGVRHMQLVHYTPNDIGDFQTGDVVHHGLTEFGKETIQACNRLGIVVDVAHATEDTTKQAVKASTKPLLLSHTALERSRAMGQTALAARQISRDHARAVAETGGSIGIWHFFSNLTRYVEGVKEMVDAVGVDHVSIGTDQQIVPGSLQDYANFTHLVEEMLRSGFSADDVAKIVGGNYVRIFSASAG